MSDSVQLPAADRPKVRKWQIQIGVLPILSGLLGGLGLLVFLQQAGTVYPTLITTILFLLGGIAVGVILPTIGTRISRRGL